MGKLFKGLPTIISIVIILAFAFVTLALPMMFLKAGLEGWDNYLRNTTQLDVAKEETKQVGIEWRHRENIARINADKDVSVAEVEHKGTFGYNLRWIIQWLAVIIGFLWLVTQVEIQLRKRGYL